MPHGGKRESFASPRQKQAKQLFFPYECFQPVGDRQVLMADAHGMWLASLPSALK